MSELQEIIEICFDSFFWVTRRVDMLRIFEVDWKYFEVYF